MIGRFKHARDAENVNSLIEKIVAQAVKDDAYSISHAPPEDQRFSPDMLALLRDNRAFHISPADLEQFASEHTIDQRGDSIVVKTQEADLSAFIKLFVDAGARVEIYSGHDYPDEEAEQRR